MRDVVLGDPGDAFDEKTALEIAETSLESLWTSLADARYETLFERRLLLDRLTGGRPLLDYPRPEDPDA